MSFTNEASLVIFNVCNVMIFVLVYMSLKKSEAMQ